MPPVGWVTSLMSVFTGHQRRNLSRAFEAVASDVAWGEPSADQKAGSHRGVYLDSTTGSSGQEVSIAHDLGVTPYVAMPVLPLQSSGYRLVPLTVTRAADDRYVYVASTSTGAPIRLYVEGGN